MHGELRNRFRGRGWGLAAGLVGIGLLGWNWRSVSRPGREDLNPHPEREADAAVVRTANTAKAPKVAAPAGKKGHAAEKGGPGIVDGGAGEPWLAEKIHRLGAGPVPEMVLWNGICEDWNVPVDLRGHCVWRAFVVTSGRERFRRDLAELQAQMPVVHDQVASDGSEIPDAEGRAMAAEVRGRMQRMTGQWNKNVEQPIEAAEAELTELTGITDPAFYIRLFAITPRVTADQLSAEGELVGGRGTAP